MKKLILLFILFLSTVTSYSQAEANNWYFGSFAGVQFQEDGTVIALSDGKMSTNEGCSSMSDWTGDLLLYTDGRTVWDRNHVRMPNGDYDAIPSTGLLGDPSSTQSGIIIPKEGDPNIYYIFTVDEPHHQNAAVYPNVFQGPYIEPNGEAFPPAADDGLNNGLNYSVVDLSVIGTNGSIGDVTTRNVHLITYDPAVTAQASYKCSEKITAVKNFDGTGYWVVAHFIDKFYAFAVTGDGVNQTPVVTQIAPVVPISGYRRNSIGCIKISPNGKKLAIAHMQLGTVEGETAENGTVFLYDFDNATGVISNPVQISNNVSPYGLEFSPESKKLYVSYDDIGLRQYNLLSENIPASEFLVANTTQAGTLQLGPNGKIYKAVVAGTTLDVINTPEEDGTLCGYENDAVFLAPDTTCFFGLPPFITSFFSASITTENTCHGQPTEFTLAATNTFDTISWDFGDGSPASTEVNPVHTYANAGTYDVIATITRDGDVHNFSEDITITPVPVANPAGNISKCDPENDAVEIFDFSINTPLILGDQDPDDYEVSYFLSQENADTGANPLNATAQANFTMIQTIYARIHDKAHPSCYATTSFTINIIFSPNITVNNEAKICANTGESITISAGTTTSQYTYLWSTGATTPTIQVNRPGSYTVTVKNSNNCEKIRTVEVTPSDVAIINSIDIVDLTDNNTVTINASPTGNVNTTYLYSINLPDGPYQESNFFEHITPGIHTVYVYDTNGCGVVAKDIAVLSIPKFFTPNGDGVNDTWDIVGMNSLFYENSSIFIYDRSGKMVASLDPKGTGWNGIYNGIQLPSTDYWYVIQLDDGRTVKGHFSMVR